MKTFVFVSETQPLPFYGSEKEAKVIGEHILTVFV